jgi:hypothetical protein
MKTLIAPYLFLPKVSPFTEDTFERDWQRSISGDELVRRLSDRIYKMFDNESTIPPRS